MSLTEILKKLVQRVSTKYNYIKIQEPDMSEICSEIDSACHSIRREFERYEEDGILEIDRIYRCTDRVEDLARNIEDYEQER